MWVFRKTEPQLWTVGYYAPGDKWEAYRDWPSEEQAAEHCCRLNGGGTDALPKSDRAIGVNGLTVRDWFAGMALSGVIVSADAAWREGKRDEAPSLWEYVEDAYCIADQMVAEKEISDKATQRATDD